MLVLLRFSHYLKRHWPHVMCKDPLRWELMSIASQYEPRFELRNQQLLVPMQDRARLHIGIARDTSILQPHECRFIWNNVKSKAEVRVPGSLQWVSVWPWMTFSSPTLVLLSGSQTARFPAHRSGPIIWAAHQNTRGLGWADWGSPSSAPHSVSRWIPCWGEEKAVRACLRAGLPKHPRGRGHDLGAPKPAGIPSCTSPDALASGWALAQVEANLTEAKFGPNPATRCCSRHLP